MVKDKWEICAAFGVDAKINFLFGYTNPKEKIRNSGKNWPQIKSPLNPA